MPDQFSFTTKTARFTRHGELAWGGENGWSAHSQEDEGFIVEDGRIRPVILPSEGLISHWPGNVRDDSTLVDAIGDNNGTLNSVTRTTSPVGNGAALQYSDDGDSAVIPNTPSLNPTHEITVSAWYYGVPFSGAGSDPLVQKPYVSHTQPYYQYSLSIRGSEYYDDGVRGVQFSLTMDDGSNGGVSYGGEDAFQLDEWTHLVATFNGETVTLYRNAEPIASAEATGPIAVYDTDLWLGRYANNDSNIRGKLASPRVYNVGLSSSDVVSLYESER
jgi:hypothetical protein